MSEPNEKTEQDSCGCCCGGKGISGKAWLIVAILVLLVVALALWSQAAAPVLPNAPVPIVAEQRQ